jgi:hypothetical protein
MYTRWRTPSGTLGTRRKCSWHKSVFKQTSLILQPISDIMELDAQFWKHYFLDIMCSHRNFRSFGSFIRNLIYIFLPGSVMFIQLNIFKVICNTSILRMCPRASFTKPLLANKNRHTLCIYMVSIMRHFPNPGTRMALLSKFYLPNSMLRTSTHESANEIFPATDNMDNSRPHRNERATHTHTHAQG